MFRTNPTDRYLRDRKFVCKKALDEMINVGKLIISKDAETNICTVTFSNGGSSTRFIYIGQTFLMHSAERYEPDPRGLEFDLIKHSDWIFITLYGRDTWRFSADEFKAKTLDQVLETV